MSKGSYTISMSRTLRGYNRRKDVDDALLQAEWRLNLLRYRIEWAIYQCRASYARIDGTEAQGEPPELPTVPHGVWDYNGDCAEICHEERRLGLMWSELRNGHRL